MKAIDLVRIQLVQKINARWMREFLAYDPSVDLAPIKVPVLAVTGSKDIQVDPADLDRIAELLPGDVELDDEREAAMVSNLLVVLCSDQATQPAVNTGSLYH